MTKYPERSPALGVGSREQGAEGDEDGVSPNRTSIPGGIKSSSVALTFLGLRLTNRILSV